MAILYGIQQCDTIRKAKQWLQQHALEFTFHDFRKDGLEIALLNRLEASLGWETMLNKRSTTWKQLSEDQRNTIDQDKAKALMLTHPTLIKRPILDTGDELLIGFSDSSYQTVL